MTLTWQILAGNTTQLIQTSRRFLKHPDDNFLAQVLREPTRKGVLLDLLLIKREGLMGEEAVGGCLGCSNHEVVEFKIFGDRKKTAMKT